MFEENVKSKSFNLYLHMDIQTECLNDFNSERKILSPYQLIEEIFLCTTVSAKTHCLLLNKLVTMGFTAV